ncbi:hypothetical protein FGRMN_2514 [Fusarium graminum]|nr:hypothetical protein FGRMN_2514 [Fusarium graminum]
MAFNNPKELLAALLQTIERDIVPLTRDGVSSGSKVFGAAILSSKNLEPYTVSTNDERTSPLLHGEINCIQTFYTQTFPDAKDRPNPRDDCIFFATHEPCSLCLSGITWSGFKELYYLFTYEDSRDQFSIPYDIDILEEVFRVKADGESEEAVKNRSLYNRTNKFFTAKSINELVLGIEEASERDHWNGEVSRVKALYNALADEYKKNKESGDERRPQCGSCQGRNVTCEFKEWTFVSGVRSSLRKDDCAQDDAIDGPESMQIQDSLLSFAESSPPAPDQEFDAPRTVVVRTGIIESTRNATSDVPQQVVPISNQHQPHDGNQIPTPSRWNETVLSEQNSSERQTAMLRFRYQIVPWLDSNAPGTSFGPKIMTLAAEKSIIMDIVIWVAMRRSRKAATSNGHESDPHLVQQFQHRLSLEDAFTANVGRSLLALGHFFYTGPSEWAGLSAEYAGAGGQYQFFEEQEEPLKTLDRFHYKTELAACIVTFEAPILQTAPVMNESFLSPSMTSGQIYDACLTHLSACCRLIHCELIPLFNGVFPTQSPSHDSPSLVWATWSNLWARCMQWFRDRPPDMIPLLESPEVDAHTATSNCPFAADVYSSAIAVQANLAVHFSSLLLLSYKPRLVKLSSSPHRLVSKSWHAQKLAKLALWNNFSDQWDPVVVATVIRVARDMTYPSQQDALLSCFQRIGDATKIPLQSEIADLQQFWSSSRHANAPTHTHP